MGCGGLPRPFDAPLGLSRARWQQLGALQFTGAHRAQQMGLTRQSVQWTVDLLAQEGGMACADPLHHQRATRVDCALRGRRIIKALHQLQTIWANALAQGLAAPGLHDAQA
jgi:hypothetical protein